MMFLRGLLTLVVAASMPFVAKAQLPLQCNPFFSADFISGVDINVCNAASDLIEPGYTPWLTEDYSEFAGDATLLLRIITSVKNAWFDATAPYHPTALGVYSRLGRRPAAESTTLNLNTAMIYASRPVLLEFFPARAQEIDDRFFTQFGLDPNSPDIGDLNTPIGIGAEAGQKVADARRYDGMNIVGDFDQTRTFNFQPFTDTTGYVPANTAYELTDPSRWQPDLQPKGRGLYKIQQFVTPQYGISEPYSYPDPNLLDRTVRPVRYRKFGDNSAYEDQANEVLDASASLTDEQKVLSEFYDNKGISIAGAIFTSGQTNNEGILEAVHTDFIANMAAHDAGIYTWNEKRRHDAVRPFSAIREIHGDNLVSAWGGPGQGTVNIKASEWKSYLPPADHPEYPSASTCFCHAVAQAVTVRTGNPELKFVLPRFPGSSRIEPGITPGGFAPLVLNFTNWSDFTRDCGESRIWSGVHFRQAVDESARVCPQFGDLANTYVQSLIDGTNTDGVRAPAEALEIPEFYNNECRFFPPGSYRRWLCELLN